MIQVGAVVPAAGTSSRMGALDKVLMPLNGRPLLLWSLMTLSAHSRISQIIVVTAAHNTSDIAALVSNASSPPGCTINLADGGDTRLSSVRNGVRALDPAIDLVLIHDAARPLLNHDLIDRGIAAGEQTDAAVAAVPVVDTIKRVDGDGHVLETLPRSELRAIQTPQMFQRRVLETCYDRLNGRDESRYTDEASLVESEGFPVSTFPGDPVNIKVTVPSDLYLVEVMLDMSKQNGDR